MRKVEIQLESSFLLWCRVIVIRLLFPKRNSQNRWKTTQYNSYISVKQRMFYCIIYHV